MAFIPAPYAGAIQQWFFFHNLFPRPLLLSEKGRKKLYSVKPLLQPSSHHIFSLSRGRGRGEVERGWGEVTIIKRKMPFPV
jgi:hypothetical protein